LKLAARIQAGEELRMREAELAHVSRLSTMGEMVAGIAHEINQPLYAIANFAGASERMLKDSENEKADRLRGLNRQIADQAVRAGEIIRRLREFVGKTDGSRSPFAVNDVVRDAAQLLTSEAQRKHVSLRIEAADNPSLIVCADKVQIEQVLVNLIRNSFDAMQDTDAGNRVATLWTSLTDGEVRITVEDKGVGVPEDRASKLFDAFFTTKESGMGMGLAVSRSIVEAHGGRIWAIPNAEVGTSFTVALPYHQREP
jgi:two-component system sensor kinase FixL